MLLVWSRLKEKKVVASCSKMMKEYIFFKSSRSNVSKNHLIREKSLLQKVYSGHINYSFQNSPEKNSPKGLKTITRCPKNDEGRYLFTFEKNFSKRLDECTWAAFFTTLPNNSGRNARMFSLTAQN